jgi:hypothetical protein
MLIDFQTCKSRFGSPYQIGKAIREGRIVKMEAGVYSEDGSESEIEVIQMKYHRAIVSFDSAYFYYDMTDCIPDKYTLTIENHAHIVKDDRIRFSFVPKDVLDVGVTVLDYDGAKIRIYDKERLLIDTTRMKGHLPQDQYKEVVNYYRANRDTLDASKFPVYLEFFPHRDRIMRIIDEEIF